MRSVSSTLALLAAATLCLPAGPAASQAAGAAPVAPTADAAEASLPERLQAASEHLQSLLTGPDAMLDADLRAENRDEVVPALVRMQTLLAEGIAAGEVPPQATDTFEMMLAIYEHEETLQRLRETAGDIGSEGDRAFGSLIAAEVLRASDDAARALALDSFADRATERPESVELVGLGGLLLNLPGMTGEDRTRVLGVLETSLTSEEATEAVAAMSQQIDAQTRLSSLVGKPLVLEGATADGGTLSTADWQGKVILVDFWATWCGPCIAELPRVEATYAEFHEQGLEILGVSCDAAAADVTSFVADRDGMPWPHLFDPEQNGWHPLAEELGITSIPTMFLIDKQGIVRSVTARENFEQMIPELLAEEFPS